MTKRKTTKPKRDVNQNVKRIFDEMIERSEQPPNRGKLKVAPPPANVREWEAAQPVIPPGQCKEGTIAPLSFSQRRCIDRQLRANYRRADAR